MLSAQHMAHTDVIMTNSAVATQSMDSYYCTVKKFVKSNYPFFPICAIYFKSYVFLLQSDTELIYSRMGQLMGITVCSSLGD